MASRTYEYDDAGRLISIDQGSTARYYYDTRSRRVKSTVGESGKLFLYGSAGQLINEMTSIGSWTSGYAYLNGRPLAKIYNVVTTSSGGGPGDPPNPDIDSEPGGQQPGTDKIVLEGGSTQTTVTYKFLYYHLDHLGTPIAMTDKGKDIVWSSEYYPFGTLYDEQVVASNEFRFPGQYHDRETDLYYNWHRYYEPELGRYISADRFARRFATKSPYGYASDNPLTYTDPLGDSVFIEIGGEQINYYDRPYDFSGLSEGERALLTDIMMLRMTREGAAVFNELANNSFHNVININRYADNRAYSRDGESACDPSVGGEGTIYYNWTTWEGGENEDGTDVRPPYIGLAHELIHVLHFNRGTKDLFDEETHTIKHENDIRRELRDEHGLPWIKIRKLP